MPKKKQRGGVRPGAGRPMELADPAKLSIMLDGELLTQLKTAAYADGISPSEWVRQAIVGALHVCRVVQSK